TAFATGGANGCAIGVFGVGTPALYCWGGNTSGILGNGTPVAVGSSSDTPVPIMGLGTEQPTDVAVGDDFACVLTMTSKVLCFGNNDYKQCGIGDAAIQPTPVHVTGLGG